jgi:hypothetical protein
MRMMTPSEDSSKVAIWSEVARFITPSFIGGSSGPSGPSPPDDPFGSLIFSS